MSDVLANGLNVNVNIQPSTEPDAGHIEVNILPTQSGEKGDDGATFRPAVSENGILSWTNDKNLENPEPVNIKGPQGNPGNNGVSPTAKVKETAEGAELTVTDAEGVTKAVLKNGKDGYTPQKGIDYFDGKPGENGYTPVKGIDYFDGKNGEPGEPGFSPTAKVTQTADGARIDITDKSGTTSAIVKNGKDGADAEGGATIDYATDEEVLNALIESDLITAVADGEGVLTDENNNVIEW